MSVQKSINKILVALQIKKGVTYYINQSQFYSAKLDKKITKYIVHTGNPKNGEEFFSKIKMLQYLVSVYKRGDTS